MFTALKRCSAEMLVFVEKHHNGIVLEYIAIHTPVRKPLMNTVRVDNKAKGVGESLKRTAFKSERNRAKF